MSQHQRTQGYTPSLPTSFTMQPGLPYSLDDQQLNQQPPAFDRSMYNENPPPTSRPTSTQPPSEYVRAYPQQPPLPNSSRTFMYGPRERNNSSGNISRLAPPSRSSPAPSPMPYSQPYDAPASRSAPTIVPVTAPLSFNNSPRVSPASSSERAERSERHSERHEGSRTRKSSLRNVRVPREVLSRFVRIASVNTAKNRETCGLLLGRQRTRKSGRDQNGEGEQGFVVTTLLIPRQHATSDTCTMDDEELVLEFSVSRNLITLGWVKAVCLFFTMRSNSVVTHRFTLIQLNLVSEITIFFAFSSRLLATPLGFMSSVDLHTHSAFQCMLPEAFAIVCAPQHAPKYVK